MGEVENRVVLYGYSNKDRIFKAVDKKFNGYVYLYGENTTNRV